MDCLSQVIGLTDLTPSECPCLFESCTPDPSYNVSTSGLYLLQEFEDIAKNLSDCGSNCGWLKTLEAARTFGVTKFVTDLQLAIANRNAVGKQFFNQHINKPDGNTYYMEGNKKYVATCLRSPFFKNASITVLKIGIWFSDVGSYPVSFYASTDLTTPIFTTTITSAVTNTWTIVDVNFALPSYSNFVPQDYYLVVENPNLAYPRYNTSFCSCGSREKQIANGANTLEFYESFGVAFIDNLNDLPDASLLNYGSGMFLVANLKCETINFLCSLPFGTTDMLTQQVASALLEAASIKLIDAILSKAAEDKLISEKVDFYVAKKTQTLEDYNARLTYIAANLPEEARECLSCPKPSSFISKRSI